jgi:hypothetical protein
MNQTTWMKTMTQERPQPQTWALPETARVWYTNPSRLETLAEGFDPISLKDMDSVALLNRIDTKFVMTSAQLLNALAAVQKDYRVLSVQGQRLNHYRTLYFDTPNFELYNLHVNGRADRYKVRSREYTDTHLSFLEVKHKTPKDRTIKDRIPTAQPVVQMNREAENWLHGVLPYDSRKLQPKLWNTFTRITLVSKQHCERVTLDVDLTFYAASKVVRLDGIAIAEVKMDSGNRASPFLAQMHAQRIHPQGFSKYCIGVSLLYEQVKKNTLKPQILWIEKMIEGVYREWIR